MTRWLFVLCIGLVVSVFVWVAFTTIRHDPTTSPGFVAAALSVLVVWPFPALWKLERAVPFCFLYLMSYLFISLFKEEGFTNPHTTSLVLTLPVTFATLFTILWKGMAVKSKPFGALMIFGMIGIGLATAFFSGAPGGAGKLIWFLREVLHMSESVAAATNFVIRKSVHLVAYGTLALSACKVAASQGTNTKRSFVAAYVWAVPHAVWDEFSQAHVVTRTGSPWDVLLDIAGMTTALLLFGRDKSVPVQE